MRFRGVLWDMDGTVLDTLEDLAAAVNVSLRRFSLRSASMEAVRAGLLSAAVVPGAVVPLTGAAAPFVARIVEQSLAEVDASLIEAAHSFGASNFQIITKVMLAESLPSLVRGVAITFVNLFGYTAMAGTVGAGGLGDIAIRYGYQRYMADVMLACIVICVVLVQLFQSFGDWLARAIDKRKH